MISAIVFSVAFSCLASACTNIGFGTDCSNHGICAFDGQTNSTRCFCDAGYFGSTCMNETATTVETSTTSTAMSTNCVDFSAGGSYAPCNGNGNCTAFGNATSTTYVCACKPKYLGKYCAQQYKAKWTAFLLSILIGWTGADLFYLGFATGGVFKLLFGLAGCCGGICVMIMYFCDQSSDFGGLHAGVKCGLAIACSCLLTVTSWWFVDWIMILTGGLTDAAGNALFDGF
jgi:hypothetical protein